MEIWDADIFSSLPDLSISNWVQREATIHPLSQEFCRAAKGTSLIFPGCFGTWSRTAINCHGLFVLKVPIKGRFSALSFKPPECRWLVLWAAKAITEQHAPAWIDDPKHCAAHQTQHGRIDFCDHSCQNPQANWFGSAGHCSSVK